MTQILVTVVFGFLADIPMPTQGFHVKEGRLLCLGSILKVVARNHVHVQTEMFVPWQYQSASIRSAKNALRHPTTVARLG